ncbi:50S ribosomal protein L3 [Candidatus Uhrbacteria bacterium]|nr:50S ribosomal protein L3 [Candidatus Uhrbacteria bacterium]
MKFILAKKLHMTQVWKDEKIVPVTVLEAGPCVVSQVKTKAKDGYDAVQVAFSKRRRYTKPVAGHLKDLDGTFRFLREFRFRKEAPTMQRGEQITLTQFAEGDNVRVTATSKGKGFAGVVKRHHFAGHPHTHGHKDQERMPGSIGSRRVRGGPIEKGKRMAGHMGVDRVTVKNLLVLKVDAEKRHLYVKGAVPGARNALVMVQSV